MGNTLGHNKQESKPQRDKKCEKEAQKKQKQQKISDKRDVRKQQCDYLGSEVDAEVDDASHVTGGDSESCLFESAENIFVDHEMSSSNGQQHELSSERSRTLIQHPQIVSSQDFQDGFSLEACIPPEIARSDAYDTLTTRGAFGDRHAVTGCSAAARPETEATTSFRGPLRSSSTRTDSLTSPPLTSLLGREAGNNKSFKAHPTSCHHPHFYNHQSDRKYQRGQHTSPLTPKVPASPCKSTPSPSTSPTTPTPHRRAANFLALFRKTDAAATSDSDDTSTGQVDRNNSSSNDEFKVKSKPMWKTWERPRSLKSQQKVKVSIFGTSRKKDKHVGETIARDATRDDVKQETLNAKVPDRSWSVSPQSDSANKMETQRHGGHQTANGTDQHETHGRPGQPAASASIKSGQVSGRESLHLSQTAAVCIMKLEELERSIERTIRDKFPDAESFLLRKRSNEELRGSRSLPTTPSLKKKLYITRDEEEGRSRMCDHMGVTRFCDETYESPPSPAKSPVILRRFGARTRHASISPKLARAKTALLFNSPSEISSLAPSTGKSKAAYHGLSIQQIPGQSVTHRLDGLSSTAHKSQSKYDNVSDAGTPDNCCPLHQDWSSEESTGHAVKTVPVEENRTYKEPQPVLRPTFSAVFGSVSPKLRRHNPDAGDGYRSQVAEKESTWTSGGSHSRSDSDSDKHVISGQGQGRTKDMVPSLATKLASLDKHRDNGHLGTRQKCSPREFGTDNTRSASETFRENSVRKFPGTECMSGQSVSINRSKLLERADSESDVVDINRDEKARTEEEIGRHTAGKLGTGSCVLEMPKQLTRSKVGSGTQKAPGQEQFSQPVRAENAASPRPAHACSATKAEKPQQAGSIEEVREQSADHALLVTALAATTSSSPSSSSGPVKSNTAHTQHVQDQRHHLLNRGSRCEDQQAASVSQQASFVSQQASFVRQQALAARQQDSTTTRLVETKDFVCSPTRHSELDAVTKDASSLPVGDVFLEQHDSTRVNSCQGHTLPVSTGQSNFVFQNNGRAVLSASLASCSSPLVLQDKLTGELTGVENSGTDQRNVCSKKRPCVQESDRKHQIRCQGTETVTVLKQPVSEVISQMINQSQRLPQQQVQLSQQHQQVHISQQQGHRMSQTGAVSLDGSSSDTKCEGATVRAPPNYQQPCQTLEYRVVVADLTSSRNNGHDVSQSCSSDFPTDGNARADNTVNTPDEATSSSGRPVFLSRPTGDTGLMEVDKMREAGNLSENEFLERVLAGSRPETRAAVHTASDHVPPPSPTIINQLMEELLEDNEDGDDDGANGDGEATSSRRDDEMKQFTDIVYKRLSDLLDGRSGREVTMESDASGRLSRELSTELTSNPENGSSGSRDEAQGETESSTAATRSSAASMLKVLTIESSSSLTTTTSSDSDIDEPPLVFQTFQEVDKRQGDDFNNDRGYVRTSLDPSALDFRELDIDIDRQSRDSDKRRGSREYHSDDDVATGRGIPDYYDDRPLWSRRQKPPGQLSETMLAVRWRERRERWLKKRRRNRTELLSTGSSDNNVSETCPVRDFSLLPETADCFEEENYKTRTTCTHDMGSGILTSPKYSKPILPFFDCIQASGSNHPLHQHPCRDNMSRSHAKHGQCSSPELGTDYRHAHGEMELDDYNEHFSGKVEQHAGQDTAAPVIEDTFQELTSVQDILVRMEEWRPADSSQGQCLPLTTENVRSIRDYYKDCCLTGGGRRSRLSATDRTESDLDIYSEMPDDGSSGSDLYADDEGDDDAPEHYANPDDGLEAAGRGSKRDNGCRGEGKTSSEANVLISYTFYNSSSQPGSRCEQDETDQAASAQRSTSGEARIPSCYGGLNSDEEFWTGSAAAMEDSYRQLETAADAVSSTFQNARVQMHDIQYHLQALRRQMEVMQDDLTHISTTLNPNTSVPDTGK